MYSCELVFIQLKNKINPEVGTVNEKYHEFHAYDVTVKLDDGKKKQWPAYFVLGRTLIIPFPDHKNKTQDMLHWIKAGTRRLEIMIPVRRGEDVKLTLDMTGAKRQINRVYPLASGKSAVNI